MVFVKAFVSFSETAMGSLTPKYFPAPITRAVFRLHDSDSFKDLPDGFIRIVISIIKKIDLSSPRKSIFANRTTIAEESGKSVETVQRAIKWLEDKGFFERQQIANPGQRGSRSPLTPTDLFLEAVELHPEGLRFSPGQHHANNAGASSSARASISPEGTPAAGTPSQGRFVRHEGMTIPADLVWLCREHALRPSAVLQLMGLASKAGKRLSTVIEATKQYLLALHGRELYAYIKALLSKDRDFGQVLKEKSEEQESSQNSEFLREKAQILEGRTFSNADGTTRYAIEDGLLVVLKDGRRAVAQLTEKFLDSIHCGRVRERWITRAQAS